MRAPPMNTYIYTYHRPCLYMSRVQLIKSTRCFNQSLPPSFIKCCVTSMRHSTGYRRIPCMHAFESETPNLYRALMKCEQFVSARSRDTCLLYCNLNYIGQVLLCVLVEQAERVDERDMHKPIGHARYSTSVRLCMYTTFLARTMLA